MHDIPSPGQVLGGKYRVLRLLGQGGMGAVLEAEHELTGKRVAVKWMHPQIAGDPEAQARFLREARASARVRHPNIVDVYDVVTEGSAAFMVMELLEGEPLSALLDRGGMPIHKLIALLLPAFRAVAAAHRQGVIHRDLKPDNIFLARHEDVEDAVAKVLDFGISKVLDPSGLSLTRTGATMGTPMYMSLEQLVGEKNIDARADVYSLGVILYEAVTGRAPFEAGSFSELAIKIATTEPPPPKQVRPDLPTPLVRLISWAMAKKREERIESVDALIRELEPFALERSFRAQMTYPEGELPSLPIAADRRSVATPAASPTLPEIAPKPVEAAPSQRPTGADTEATDTRSIKRLWPRLVALSAVVGGIAVAALWGMAERAEPGPAARSFQVVARSGGEGSAVPPVAPLPVADDDRGKRERQDAATNPSNDQHTDRTEDGGRAPGPNFDGSRTKTVSPTPPKRPPKLQPAAGEMKVDEFFGGSQSDRSAPQSVPPP